MVTKAKKPDLRQIEDRICGFCAYYVAHPNDDSLCLAYPPQIATENDEIFWLRGAPVMANDPACHLYRPKHNS